MDSMKEGVYEEVISKLLERDIEKNSDKYFIEKEKIDSEEASNILSFYLKNVIKTILDDVGEKSKNSLKDQVEFINKFIEFMSKESKNIEFEDYLVSSFGQMLYSVYKKENRSENLVKSKKMIKFPRPETSLVESSLFTGAVNEPQMQMELKKEILTSDRIDILVSFIKWSGLRIIIKELAEFTKRGGRLRVITTSYMGATDPKAVDEISKLENTTVKISYDTKITRLHAKSYIFYRDTGFTTAYIGSSNISKAALTSGLEWNVKISKKDQSHTLDKIEATFESYWNSYEFEIYTKDKILKLKEAIISEKNNDAYIKDRKNNYIFDIRPYSYQNEVLDKLQAEREIRNRYKNLLVAATGVGKTVIAAFDYKRFKNSNSRANLLFIAHRKEILKQSIETFRAILKDANFGELFVGNYKPESLENLFVSIQTFNSRDFTNITSKDFYDFIIVDEFHHAAADSYKNLLNYYKPKILLGLTATPERMDGKHNELYEIFDNKIVAEIRLPEAIDRKLLCPFQYFGVSDVVDLSDLKWSRGGYDISELSNVFTISREYAKKRAEHIVSNTLKYVNDIDEVKGLGFCVSVAHSDFMAEFFNLKGIKSVSLSASSSEELRNSAKERLVRGDIKFIFTVDLYNEGVDIPEVNTVLFLRPTESLTVFLQQLGRGLRISEGKDCLTVLDFIGQANRRYNFADKFSALLENTQTGVLDQIKNGFTKIPKGCYINLEKKASQWVIENIKSSFANRSHFVNSIKTFEQDSSMKLNLKNFLKYYHLSLSDVYSRGSFYRMMAQAGVIDDFCEEIEENLTKAFKKIIFTDSRRFIKLLLNILNFDKSDFSKDEKKLLNMFNITVCQKEFESGEIKLDLEIIDKIKNSPNMKAELLEILNIRYEMIDFVDKKVDLGFSCPLDLYCTYTRDQILVAFDHMKPSNVREGVKYIKDKNTDIFFITLNKSDKDYSPTTMYKDYSINEELFHWQSQSSTSETSATGMRYINHRKKNSNVLLFVRENKYDRKMKMAASYTYLGRAFYVSHKGSKPMSIIWKLENKIPGKFIDKTNKLIAK